MTANIFGERFLGRRAPAWHGLGQTFDAPIGALEGIETAQLDYRVLKVPMTVGTPKGDMLEVPGKFILLREGTPDDKQWRYFGAVGSEYEVVQNTDIGRLLDPLTEKWPVETVGALDLGKTMFITLDAGAGSIKGDKVRKFFLVTDTKDGGTSLRIAYTPVRVVCQNTLSIGLSQATLTVALEHGHGVQDELAFRVHLVHQMQRAMVEVDAAMTAMASVTISREVAGRIIGAAYPYDDVPARVELAEQLEGIDLGDYGELMADSLKEAQARHSYFNSRKDVMREEATNLFHRFNDENPKLAMTPWAAYNAVVELEDYRRGGKGAQRSMILGGRAKTKRHAFAAALGAAQRAK
mgnify:CR=1 FL=1